MSAIVAVFADQWCYVLLFVPCSQYCELNVGKKTIVVAVADGWYHLQLGYNVSAEHLSQNDGLAPAYIFFLFIFCFYKFIIFPHLGSIPWLVISNPAFKFLLVFEPKKPKKKGKNQQNWKLGDLGPISQKPHVTDLPNVANLY